MIAVLGLLRWRDEVLVLTDGSLYISIYIFNICVCVLGLMETHLPNVLVSLHFWKEGTFTFTLWPVLVGTCTCEDVAKSPRKYVSVLVKALNKRTCEYRPCE